MTKVKITENFHVITIEQPRFLSGEHVSNDIIIIQWNRASISNVTNEIKYNFYTEYRYINDYIIFASLLTSDNFIGIIPDPKYNRILIEPYSKSEFIIHYEEYYSSLSGLSYTTDETGADICYISLGWDHRGI